MISTISIISIVVASVALFISALSAWLTLLRRGTVQMTRPTVIYFGPDGSPQVPERPGQKVYLRALLYGTSKQGRILESMFVRLRRGESAQNFNIWVYGDTDLSRGSGLFVGENGVATNHHFLLPADGTHFEFLAGQYTLEVYASLVGGNGTLCLFSTRLEISNDIATMLRQPDHGVYFDWGPDSNKYHPHVREHKKLELPRFLRELAG